MRVIAVSVAEPGDANVDLTQLRRRIQDAFVSSQSVDVNTPTWVEPHDLHSVASDGAECLVVVFTDTPSTPPMWVRALPRALPTVVVAPDVGSTAFALRSIQVAEIFDHKEIEDDPDSVMRRIASASILGRARSVIRHAPGLSGILRSWMTRLVDVFPPYGSISDSIDDFGRSASTLRRHWRKHVSRSRPLTFLRWLLLIRAVLIRSPGRSWNEVASNLGISRRRLERAAHDLADGPLKGLLEHRRRLREVFEAYLTHTLLRGRRTE